MDVIFSPVNDFGVYLLKTARLSGQLCNAHLLQVAVFAICEFLPLDAVAASLQPKSIPTNAVPIEGLASSLTTNRLFQANRQNQNIRLTRRIFKGEYKVLFKMCMSPSQNLQF